MPNSFRIPLVVIPSYGVPSLNSFKSVSTGNQEEGILPVTFSAEFISGRVRVTFSEEILNTPSIHVLSNYTLTPPAGAQGVSVVGVEFSSGWVDLFIDQEDLVQGASYGVTLREGTALSADRATPNPLLTVSFVGKGTRPSAHAKPGPNLLRVTYSKPVRMGPPSNLDSALRLQNYAITDGNDSLLSIFGVTAINAVTVEIQTASQEPVPYVLSISGVKDLAGNEVL